MASVATFKALLLSLIVKFGALAGAMLSFEHFCGVSEFATSARNFLVSFGDEKGVWSIPGGVAYVLAFEHRDVCSNFVRALSSVLEHPVIDMDRVSALVFTVFGENIDVSSSSRAAYLLNFTTVSSLLASAVQWVDKELNMLAPFSLPTESDILSGNSYFVSRVGSPEIGAFQCLDFRSIYTQSAAFALNSMQTICDSLDFDQSPTSLMYTVASSIGSFVISISPISGKLGASDMSRDTVFGLRDRVLTLIADGDTRPEVFELRDLLERLVSSSGVHAALDAAIASLNSSIFTSCAESVNGSSNRGAGKVASSNCCSMLRVMRARGRMMFQQALEAPHFNFNVPDINTMNIAYFYSNLFMRCDSGVAKIFQMEDGQPIDNISTFFDSRGDRGQFGWKRAKTGNKIPGGIIEKNAVLADFEYTINNFIDPARSFAADNCNTTDAELFEMAFTKTVACDAQLKDKSAQIMCIDSTFYVISTSSGLVIKATNVASSKHVTSMPSANTIINSRGICDALYSVLKDKGAAPLERAPLLRKLKVDVPKNKPKKVGLLEAAVAAAAIDVPGGLFDFRDPAEFADAMLPLPDLPLPLLEQGDIPQVPEVPEVPLPFAFPLPQLPLPAPLAGGLMELLQAVDAEIDGRDDFSEPDESEDDGGAGKKRRRAPKKSKAQLKKAAKDDEEKAAKAAEKAAAKAAAKAAQIEAREKAKASRVKPGYYMEEVPSEVMKPLTDKEMKELFAKTGFDIDEVDGRDDADKLETPVHSFIPALDLDLDELLAED